LGVAITAEFNSCGSGQQEDLVDSKEISLMADAGEGAGEFHGLPREAFSPDEPAELEIRHTEQDADWDFRPWLSEKLNRMQTAAKDLVGVWITNPRFANERRCRGKLILKQLRCGLLRFFPAANSA